jgi:hypothetical protein
MDGPRNRSLSAGSGVTTLLGGRQRQHRRRAVHAQRQPDVPASLSGVHVRVGLPAHSRGGVGLVTRATRTRLMGCAHSPGGVGLVTCATRTQLWVALTPGGVSGWLHVRPELDLWVACSLPGVVRLVTRYMKHPGYQAHVGYQVDGIYWLSSKVCFHIAKQLCAECQPYSRRAGGEGAHGAVRAHGHRGGAAHAGSCS